MLKKPGMLITIGVTFMLTVVPSWLGWYDNYIQYVITLIGINIILSSSLNLINGFMGEFNVGHAAFMGVGAYVASLLTVWLLVDDNMLGKAVIGPNATLIIFPIALIIGGIAAAIFSLLVAFPSFRTRGDYLAIITLAVNFIFKSTIENIDVIGGPRGFMGMGKVIKAMDSALPAPWVMLWTFIFTVLTLFLIRNFVSSTIGKAVIAIREDEIAAELMTVDTRRTKLIAFMLGCGLAGIAGGLHGHAVSFINPSSYFILQSTNILIMVYLAGMGTISGSVLSAVFFTILLEFLRPLDMWRWVLTPLLLIILMLFRPSGIMGSRELPDLFPQLKKYFNSLEESLKNASATD